MIDISKELSYLIEKGCEPVVALQFLIDKKYNKDFDLSDKQKIDIENNTEEEQKC